MNDQHAGMGGSYVIAEDGARRLVDRTQEAPVVSPVPQQQSEPAAPIWPADTAGFLTPADSVASDRTTTTE